MDERGDDSGTAARLAAYDAANRTINGWAEGAHALALLDAAVSSGLFGAARAPGTPAQLATVAGLDERRVANLCVALDAHGVFDRDGEAYRLAPDFAALAAPDAPKDPAVVVRWHLAVARRLAAAATAGEAGAASPEETLAIARGVTSRPDTPPGLAARGELYAGWPEVTAVWEAGGCHLELGCGIGGAVLSTLMLYPRLCAVGVDVDATALAEARRAADALGLADRLTLRLQDARDLDDEAAFDTAQWSQFFFPAETRAATLAAAYRALKPGGYLGMPRLPDAPTTTAALREPLGRAYARVLVQYGLDGIPLRSAAELRAEVEAAGFAFVRAGASGRFLYLLARRPTGDRHSRAPH